jgi:hypothetical protein
MCQADEVCFIDVRKSRIELTRKYPYEATLRSSPSPSRIILLCAAR